MDVAVADDSPLGRYLAELDAHEEATSLAAQLQPTPPSTAPLAGKPQATPGLLRKRGVSEQLKRKLTHHVGVWKRMQRSAQRLAVAQLLGSLDPTTELRSVVLDAAALPNELPTPVRCWLVHTVQNLGVPTSGFAILLTSLVIGYYAISWTLPELCVWHPSALLLCPPIALELVYQGLVGYYSLVSRRLMERMSAHALARADLQTAFTQALDVVKRSELVARGYRLGRGLPPVGRLEEASSARATHVQLQCRRLRLRLRDANDAFEQACHSVASRAAISPTVKASAAEERDSDSATPSLLVTALAKRYELSEILLESALRDTLVEDLAQLVSSEAAEAHEVFPEVVSRQTQTYELLSQLMRSWSEELHQWHTRLHHYSSAQDTKSEKVPHTPASAAAVKVPREVASVSGALVEFQASCETLKALATASQHDIVDCIASSAASSTSETETVPFDREQWQAKLQRSREQMAKLTQQLTSDWERLEQAADAAVSGAKVSTSDGVDRSADENVECESPASALPVQPHLSQQDAEREYLLVFTATSTGEKDFDLQELLLQQRLDDERRLQSAATPVPSFMGELQGVLEQRTALPSAPILVKRIGYEPLPASSQQPTQSSMPQTERAAPKAVDIQQLLQSRFTAQLHEESFGASSDEEDNDNDEQQ